MIMTHTADALYYICCLWQKKEYLLPLIRLFVKSGVNINKLCFNKTILSGILDNESIDEDTVLQAFKIILEPLKKQSSMELIQSQTKDITIDNISDEKTNETKNEENIENIKKRVKFDWDGLINILNDDNIFHQCCVNGYINEKKYNKSTKLDVYAKTKDRGYNGLMLAIYDENLFKYLLNTLDFDVKYK